MLEAKKVSFFTKKQCLQFFISSSSENVRNLEGNTRGQAILVINSCSEQSSLNSTKRNSLHQISWSEASQTF